MAPYPIQTIPLLREPYRLVILHKLLGEMGQAQTTALIRVVQRRQTQISKVCLNNQLPEHQRTSFDRNQELCEGGVPVFPRSISRTPSVSMPQYPMFFVVLH